MFSVVSLKEKEREGQQWLSISVQSTILGINILLISQKIVNSYLLISISFIFSLFILQLISHRLLYYRPINKHMMMSTPHVDTFILYLFSLLSAFCLYLGLAHSYNIPVLNSINAYLKRWIIWILALLVVPIPAYFSIWGRKQITKSITKKLKDKTMTYTDKCPQCGGAAIFDNKVIEWNDLRIVNHCKNCAKNNPIEYKMNLRIG